MLTAGGGCVSSGSGGGVSLSPPGSGIRCPGSFWGTPPCHHSREVRMGFCDACLPPRDWLQRRQTVRVFSGVSSPPCAWGTMWSASALLGSRDTL